MFGTSRSVDAEEWMQRGVTGLAQCMGQRTLNFGTAEMVKDRSLRPASVCAESSKALKQGMHYTGSSVDISVSPKISSHGVCACVPQSSKNKHSAAVLGPIFERVAIRSPSSHNAVCSLFCTLNPHHCLPSLVSFSSSWPASKPRYQIQSVLQGPSTQLPVRERSCIAFPGATNDRSKKRWTHMYREPEG